MMLYTLTGTLSLNLLLFLLANLFYQNRYVRIVRNAAFLIALLIGTACGVVAYLIKSPTYISELRGDWFTYAGIHFFLSLKLDSAIANSIGFYSLLHLIILFLTRRIFETRERYNYLFSAYFVMIGLLLSNDLMTFLFFWCWSAMVLMLLIRQELSSFNYPPILGIFVLLILCLLIINFSRQTFLPDERILSRCPNESMVILGSLVTIIILIQGCQFPFPLWLPIGTSTNQDLATTFIYYSNVFFSCGTLVWKFDQILLPLYRVILCIGGFLTILLAFIRIYVREVDPKTSLTYFLSGMLGLALITLLSDNSPFLVQMLAGFQVIVSLLIIGQLRVKSVGSKSQFFTDSVDFVTLALITGVPLSIHHVIRLTMLRDLLTAQTPTAIQRIGIILIALGTLAIIGMATRIMIRIRQNRPEGELSTDEGSANRQHLIALMLTWGLSLWFPYPLEPASGLVPISQSILLTASYHQTVGIDYLSLLNQLTTGFWVLGLVGFLFLGNKITFPPLVKWSRTSLYTNCLGQIPSRLVNLILSLESITRRQQNRLGELLLSNLPSLSATIKVTTANWHFSPLKFGKQLRKLFERRLWLLGIGMALLAVGIVLLILYFLP